MTKKNINLWEESEKAINKSIMEREIKRNKDLKKKVKEEEKEKIEGRFEKREETQGILMLVGLFILGWITIVVSFYKQNLIWFIIGNIVIGLVGLTAYHIMKRNKQEVIKNG